MRILGIDPGVAITGYAVIEELGCKFKRVDSGVIRTARNLPAGLRLAQIQKRVLELIDLHRPDALALEQLFFSKNIRTALQVGEARGVIILTAALCELELFEYTPLQVKQAVAGYGRAEKAQIQNMVVMLLNLNQVPAVDDEADALAVGLCHLQHRRWGEALKGGR